MPGYDGQLLTLDLVLTLFGVNVKVVGTVEVLQVRREVGKEKEREAAQAPGIKVT